MGDWNGKASTWDAWGNVGVDTKQDWEIIHFCMRNENY